MLILLSLGSSTLWTRAADYLPLQAGTRWVLKHAGTNAPVTIEVVSQNGNDFRIQFSHPWGENEWDLQPQGNKVLMTGYGQNGSVAPMPGGTVFFSFAGNDGEAWSNAIGKLSVSSTHLSVNAESARYDNCIQIMQVSGRSTFYYAFAPGVGFVQFGNGKDAFVLDARNSHLPGSGPPVVEDNHPAQHVPGGILGGAGPTGSIKSNIPRRSDSRPLAVGVTVSTFANESATPQNLLKRFDQSAQAGVTFLSSAQKWTEIERKPGLYNLEGLDFQISTAARLGIPVSVTLRLIDTVDRVVPGDMKRTAWDSPEMARRVLPLVDAMAAHFAGRVKWFMFGNEIDGYFGRHPDEITAFAKLFTQVKDHVRQHAPGTQVSSTLMFGGIDSLNGALKPLNAQYDFLSITYYPIRGNFTMRPPDSVYGDFDRMRAVANGRKVVLQEIGYPSAALNDSSQDKQAEFYRDVFDAMRRNRDLVEAGNFFLLADLSSDFVRNLAGFYGMPSQKVFLSYLQTLGMFDDQGRPKKSWAVFQSELKQVHAANR